MMKRIVLVLFLLFVLGSASAQKFQDTIPFRDDLGLIIIPLDFNGKTKYFAFDTGAQNTIAYDWAKEDLKSTRKTLTVVSSSGRRSRMRYYKSGTITLGSRKVTGHRILNAPKNAIFSCHKVDGILGVDIIQLLNWKIDFKHKRLIMYPSKFIPKEVDSMHPMAFRFYNNKPIVFLKRKKNQFRFLLDTGASGHTNISKKDYNLVGLDAFQKVSIYSGSYDVNGIFTATSPAVFRFPESISKEVRLEPIIFYDNLKSSKIGNKLWTNNTLFLSLRQNKFYVSSATVKTNYEDYPCTVALRKGKMVVLKIIKDSEPWQLGLRQGDEIEAINGKTFTDFCSLDQYQRRIFKAGKEVTLDLTNGKRISLQSQVFIE